MAPYVPVAQVTEVLPGQATTVEVAGQSIALCNVHGTFYAIENRCSHDNGPLGAGRLTDHRIECPRHGAQFDVATGQALTLPAVRPVHVFPTKVEGGQVFVEVP